MNGGKNVDENLKKALQAAYRAPAPERKAAFLKRHRRRELGRWELLAIQAGYIRWWTWGMSLALFGVILWVAYHAGGMGTWYAAALTPFLALLAATENGRSRFYQMEELELACRMGRHSVVLARMVALGLFHLALLAGLAPPLASWDGVAIARTGVYLLTPYLLTAALGIELTRRVRGQEGLVACGGGAALVSALGLFLATRRAVLNLPEGFPLWVAALALSTASAGIEVIRSLREMEELQWN